MININYVDIYIHNILEMPIIWNRIDWNGLYVVFQEKLLIFIIINKIIINKIGLMFILKEISIFFILKYFLSIN